MTSFGPQTDRLFELLAERAVQGLSARDQAELERLLDSHNRPEVDDFDLAAAALDVALAGGSPEPMPESVRRALQVQGTAFVAGRAAAAEQAAGAPEAVVRSVRPAAAPFVPGTAAPSQSRTSPRSSALSGLGWLAAAACLALAGAAWFGPAALKSPATPAVAQADPAERRAAMLASSTDYTQWDWVALGELENRPITGDAVWSSSRREGYMTFAGLPTNDPAREQYQLWIFDPSQSDKTPIDGGVFDMPASGATVTVPIDPKLVPRGPVMFAITIEKPGGVVVSDRSRLVLIAKPG
ncbi:MAG: anti-sigma factor [Planctomycetota bacterium]|nr:anti-sigma factor [Planctomycetota bacterium]